MALFLSAGSLLGADAPNPSAERAAAPRARKNEIKLYITAASAARALEALKLDEHRAVKQSVCFFDTAEGALEANHLILRARQKASSPGESTVKLRALDGATVLTETERAIVPEQDWTTAAAPTLSRSIDHETLAPGLVPKAATGQAAVTSLFNETQRKLVLARMSNFNWDRLRCYGLIETKVWRQQWKLEGFPEEVTVELWHLRKDGRSEDVLEVSAKAKADTDTEAEARDIARQFFDAAKAAGLGEPAGQTKTKQALEFFKPGRPVRE